MNIDESDLINVLSLLGQAILAHMDSALSRKTGRLGLG